MTIWLFLIFVIIFIIPKNFNAKKKYKEKVIEIEKQ